MDLFVRTRSLAAELIAGDVQNLQTLFMIIPVHLFNRFVLRGKAAAGSGIDNHDDLALVCGQVQFFAGSGGNGVVIDHFCYPPLYFIKLYFTKYNYIICDFLA